MKNRIYAEFENIDVASLAISNIKQRFSGILHSNIYTKSFRRYNAPAIYSNAFLPIANISATNATHPPVAPIGLRSQLSIDKIHYRPVKAEVIHDGTNTISIINTLRAGGGLNIKEAIKPIQ